MSTGTQTPALEDIDSPEHRELYDVSLLIGVGKNTNYGELIRHLSQYGRVDCVTKEASEPFLVMVCTDSGAERLKKAYEQHGKRSPLRYVTEIYPLADDAVHLIE